MLPNVALIVVFTYRPLFQNIYYSTLNWTLGSKFATPVGLGNYREFFASGEASKVLTTTAIFTVATVGFTLALGLGVALALNRKLPGAGFAQATVFAPYILSGYGVGLAWLYIFDPNIGALSAILRDIGLNSPEWINSPPWTLTMVIIVYVWKNLGYAAVVYLAGLQAVPAELLEAADLDGAGPVRRFFTVTVPLLSPTTFFLMVTTILSSLQAFDLLIAMDKLGRGSRTLIFDAYLTGFKEQSQAGYSAMLSTVLFAILVVLTLIQLIVVERRVHYR
ncbi:carbohydrate ABC transporter permease [Nocardioides albus]|uniref:sn-glycerol 3-phosphate transport system permease protein n=1 Tax=Nocardioides albus TaxID=1841 RepID=A0A7W5FAV8_9ACTN|nr:sugar ABC transporter permease [Nocardioides albus]MBB3091689.1 sn-glycerol 3-phosphate transport system permease protein [Nocardioides albus]